MEGSGSLINLEGLARPATVLVEKISDAVGGLFRPYQIRRLAEADADADRIKALAQIEISDLQRRALQRFIAEEAKKQDNIESITSQALPGVTDEARPEAVEDDWITNFFDKARLISDEDMQVLWAKVLTGEANSPGRFAKRTVDFLGSLDKDDAMLFQTLLGFGWKLDQVVPLVFDVQHEIYNRHGVNYGTLTHMDEIGLISFNSLAGYDRINLPRRLRMFYYGRPIDIEAPEGKDRMSLGTVMLSRVGRDLAPVVDSNPVPGFIEYVVAQFREAGFIVTGLDISD